MIRVIILLSLPLSLTTASSLDSKDGGHHPNSVYSQISAHKKKDLRIFYQTGDSDAELPLCSPFSVCGKMDTYGSPWLEKQCRCGVSAGTCSTSTHIHDGHTIQDRTKQYKICEPAKKLKKCRYFRDITWSNIIYPDNTSQQVFHCRCPKNSVAYLVKRHAYNTDNGIGYQFSFACSPQTLLLHHRAGVSSNIYHNCPNFPALTLAQDFPEEKNMDTNKVKTERVESDGRRKKKK